MSDIDDIKAAVNEWNNGLDGGDIERMIASCDNGVITCNNGQALTVGTQAIRDKYAPRIAAFDIKSSYDYEHIKVFGDFAVVVGEFGGEMTDKATGETRTAGGRLLIGYRRNEEGEWKMALDVDNNGA